MLAALDVREHFDNYFLHARHRTDADANRQLRRQRPPKEHSLIKSSTPWSDVALKVAR
jgi:hypothetical protein